jgi:hypothetical protein
MAKLTNKMKVLSFEGKVKVTRQKENGKRKFDVFLEFDKFYDPNDLEKKDQNY